MNNRVIWLVIYPTIWIELLSYQGIRLGHLRLITNNQACSRSNALAGSRFRLIVIFRSR